MAAPYNSLSNKCEAALISAVTTLVAGASELTGTDDDTKASPQVIAIAATSGEEEPIMTGNYRMACRVEVKTQAADTTLAAHQTHVATVFDALRKDDIAATLSTAVADFHVIAVRQDGEETDNTETQFVQAILLDLYCCSADL